MRCYDHTDDRLSLLSKTNFWLAILTIIIAMIGLIGNSISAFILTRRMAFSTFNRILAFLAWTDSVFLILLVLDMIRQEFNFGIVNDAILILFPHVIHPIKAISLACSTLLVVSISVERECYWLANQA